MKGNCCVQIHQQICKILYLIIYYLYKCVSQQLAEEEKRREKSEGRSRDGRHR